MWIRFVLVPGLTDDMDDLAKTAEFAAGLGNVERVEVLPFHQLGRFKWERLGLDYRLKDVQSPTAELGGACLRGVAQRRTQGELAAADGFRGVMQGRRRVLDTVRHLLEQSPMLALFASIGLGYAFGRISVAGFSLDIGAVLFAGLALGAIAPASAPPALVSSIGLVMFLYGIGIQYGRQFFAGLRGSGLKWNALGAVERVVLAGRRHRRLGARSAFRPRTTLGMFAGALTSTPTLQAAIDAVGDRSPAIGYSVAYPIGVIGPILCIFVFSRLVQARARSAAGPAGRC